jgi:hypothetical protein
MKFSGMKAVNFSTSYLTSLNVELLLYGSHFREYHGHYAEIPPSDWAIETALIHIKKYAETLSEVGQTAMFDSTIYKLLRANYGHVLDVFGYVLGHVLLIITVQMTNRTTILSSDPRILRLSP